MPTARKDRISMKGDGYYATVSAGPRAVVDGMRDTVIKALMETGRVGLDGPVTIADFGAADGLIAIDLMDHAVAAIRGAAPRQPIRIYATDLPDTDFRPFFRAMARPDSYVHRHDDVYVATCGLSFFEPLFPPGALHLGFSASAMHYLSCMPASLGDRLHSLHARGEALIAFRAQAAADWEAILKARAVELAPKGRFVVAMLGLDDEGRHLGNTGGASLFETYERLWREMADEGIVSAEEFIRAAFQQHYRSRAELVEPFQPGGSAQKRGLEIVRMEPQTVACPFRAQWLRDGDTDRFARDFVKTHRSWTETVFANALDPAREARERQQIVDTLYGRFEALVRAEPRLHRKDLVHWRIEIAKKG